MNCFDLMKKDVVCLTAEDTIQVAAKVMAETNVGFLPVVESAGKPIGTLTDRDITIRVACFDKKASETKVADVMTREVIACNSSDDIKDAEQVMSDNQKSRLMVTDDDGKLVGVISLSDLPRESEEAYETFKEVTEREVHP